MFFRVPLMVATVALVLLIIPSTGYAAFPASECNPEAEGGGAVAAWGYNFHDQLAAGYEDSKEFSPVPVVTQSVPIVTLTNVKQVDSAASSSFALLGDCALRSWGGDDRGQLGNGVEKTEETWPLPSPVKAIVTEEGKEEIVELKNVKEVVAANQHVIALLNDGTVWTWGASEYGERGNGEKGPREEPNIISPRDLAVQVTALENKKVLQVTTGGRRDYALIENQETEEEEIYVWGEDKNEELGVATAETCSGTGYGEKSCVTEPTLLTSLKGDIKSLAAGEWAAYALVGGEEVKVEAWGQNTYGQLGIGSTETKTEPQEVALPKTPSSPVLEVTAGKNHALAVRSDGVAFSWGDNEKGELGHTSTQECGSHSCSIEPEEVEMPEGANNEITAVSGGANYSLLIDSGDVYAMGNNEYGKLGIGDPTEQTKIPTLVPGLSSVKAVTAGNDHSIALLEAGESGPLPRLNVIPGLESLRVEWTSLPAALLEYKLNWWKGEEKLLERYNKECPANVKETACYEVLEGLPSNVEQEIKLGVCEFVTKGPEETGGCKAAGGQFVSRNVWVTPE